MTTYSERGSLWNLIIGPTIWAGHFLACYLYAAVYCAKIASSSGEFGTLSIVVAGITLLALVLIAITAVDAWRRRPGAGQTTSDELDTPESSRRLLSNASLMLCALSAVSVLYVALAALFITSCR